MRRIDVQDENKRVCVSTLYQCCLTKQFRMDKESDSIKLIREAIRTRDAPSIPKYRDDLVKNTIVEINSLSTLIPAKSTAASNTIKSAFLQRRKRCILAYQRERLNRYKELLWLSGATTSSTLPENSYHAASSQELLFIKEYQDLVSTWKGLWLDVDVGASITPPKDVFVEIRVIQDCGEIMTDSGPLLLSAGSQRYVKRSDVEDLILAGKVEHVI